MEQFGFAQLSDDDQLLVLKYMPIKQRVRFERVNTAWASLLDRLWLGQKQLQFNGTQIQRHTVEPRLIAKCHRICRNDECDINHIKSADVMCNILSRCKNLKALRITLNLYLDVNSATKLANVLNNNCRELEHLDECHLNLVFFELFEPSDKFTCLVYPAYERLKRLYNEKSSAVNSINMKFIIFGIHSCTFSWNLINKVTVENLHALYWEDKYNELINLKSLVVDWQIYGEMGTFSKLEHIALRSPTTTDLRRIFKNSPKLVSLKLQYPYGQMEIGELMPTLVEYGSNLRVLKVSQQECSMMGDYAFWQNLAKFTKLRKLVIRGVVWYPGIEVVKCKLNVNGLALLLQKCTKLKFVKIHWPLEDITTEAEKEQIRRVVADKSYRQSFVVSFQGRDYYLRINVCVGQKAFNLPFIYKAKT